MKKHAGRHLLLHEFVPRTGGSLEGIDGSVDASRGGAVLPRPHLRVHRADVEKHAAFLEGQRSLTGRDACQRVVPDGWTEQRRRYHQRLIMTLSDSVCFVSGGTGK